MIKDKQNSFEKISTFSALKENLDSKAKHLHDTKDNIPRYICHYTSLEAAIGIIKEQSWYIGSPKHMNDGLELTHAKPGAWNHVFFANFMYEPIESIAMWSMYAQPWKKGVMLRIPVAIFKKWVYSKPILKTADPNTKKSKTHDISEYSKLQFHAVAYTNSDSRNINESEEISCGDQKNRILQNVVDAQELIGYVKDNAWSYENEYRIQVAVDPRQNCDAVSLAVPTYIVNSMEIVAGPRFQGDIKEKVRAEIGKTFEDSKSKNSIFQGKLNWIYCDSCGNNVSANPKRVSKECK